MAARRGPAWAPWSSHCDDSTTDLARSRRAAFGVLSRPAVGPVSRRAAVVSLCGPGGPSFGPAAGPRSGRFGALTWNPLPARSARPVQNRYLYFTPRRPRETQLRAAPGRGDLRPCADGRDPTTSRNQGSPVWPPAPVAVDSFAPLGAWRAFLFLSRPRGPRGPTTSVAPPRGLRVRCSRNAASGDFEGVIAARCNLSIFLVPGPKVPLARDLGRTEILTCFLCSGPQGSLGPRPRSHRRTAAGRRRGRRLRRSRRRAPNHEPRSQFPGNLRQDWSTVAGPGRARLGRRSAARRSVTSRESPPPADAYTNAPAQLIGHARRYYLWRPAVVL